MLNEILVTQLSGQLPQIDLNTRERLKDEQKDKADESAPRITETVPSLAECGGVLKIVQIRELFGYEKIGTY